MGYVVHGGVLFYVIREGHRIVSELTSAIEKATVFKTKDAALKAIEDNGGRPRKAKVARFARPSKAVAKRKKCKGHTVEVRWLKKAKDLIRQGGSFEEDFVPAARAAGDSLVKGVDRVTLCELSGLMEILTSDGACVMFRLEQVVLPSGTVPYMKKAT